MDKKALSRTFETQMRQLGIQSPAPEHKFHETRKWRIDYAWPEHMIGVEVEGGIWSKGGHVRGSGFIKNCEKYNAAAMAGWCILRYPTNAIEDGSGVTELENFLKLRGVIPT